MNDCISKNAYLNNSIVPVEDVKNALFIGKITVYEVIRVIDFCPLFIEDHLDRFEKSAALLSISLPFSISNICLKINEFIKRESIDFGNVKIQFTCNDSEFYLLIYQLQHSYPTDDMYANGVKTKTLKVVRENPNAKNIQSFHAIAQTFIKENSIYEAILIDNEEHITEGSKSNIFFIKGNSLITALTSDVLLGITRKYVIEAAKTIGLTVVERKTHFRELSQFDAAFISGTSPKILPIASIDTFVYRTNSELLKKLMSQLDESIHQYSIKHKSNR